MVRKNGLFANNVVNFPLVWIEQGKVEKEKGERVKTFRSAKEIFLNYTEDSTIQGLIYVFFPYQVMNITQTINISGQARVGKYFCLQAV